MKQPIKNTYPPDLTVGTNMFFVNTNIIDYQHVAGVKSPLLRIIENTKQVQDGKLLNTSTTAHRVFTELQFKKLITSTIEEIQIELMSITGQKVPFVGTGLVALKNSHEEVGQIFSLESKMLINSNALFNRNLAQFTRYFRKPSASSQL